MAYTNYYPYANISDVIAYKVVGLEDAARAEKKIELSDTVLAVNKEGVVKAPAASKPVEVSSPVIPYAYPLYKQCDPRWGNDLIYTDTVCAVGCLMSSVSMAIGGHNMRITNSSGVKVTSDPGTLNAWLKAHKGYDQNDLDEAVVPGINPTHIQWSDASGMHTTNNIPLSQIQTLIKQKAPVIANVMAGHHFVLVTGWDSANPDTLMVNDPGFDRTTYSYTTDVVGWRLFTMQQCTGTSC
jgi:Peptidase_C39 like family